MEKKLTNIKERVLFFCKHKGMSIEPFLESIGMTYGSFKGKAKKGSLNSDAIANIYTNFTDLNLEWLLTGDGDMIKPNSKSNLNVEKTIFKDGLNDTNHLVFQSMKETIESQKTTIKSLQLTIDYLNKNNNNSLLDFENNTVTSNSVELEKEIKEKLNK